MQKYKFQDLEKIMKKLNQHSKKGDIELSINKLDGALTFKYTSNVETETELVVYPGEMNKFVYINESKWLE